MAGMALLWGVSPSELVARITRSDGAWSPFDMPPQWMQRAKRRAAEARAHTGSNALEDVLRYWADKDCDADIEIVYS
ncbi:hypothetical protein A5791_19815 [Mycobacterium sp. 852002-51163_SCH5372311]|nr:hypothetical protein A5791_19815 [Mycobacterium sp. 852002-51163_SCH5372311]